MSFVGLLIIFFGIMLVGTVLVLMSRRIILGRYLQWRLEKIREWGRIIDGIIARMDEPTPAEVHSLEVVGPMTRSVLEDVLMSRIDLMAGNSRIPLIRLFQRSRLLNLCITELEHKSVMKRRKAADMLGRAAGRDYAGHLMNALDDPDGAVRVIAARSLGKMGIQIAAVPMVEQFKALEENECRMVADALINLGSAALLPLSVVLLDRRERVRYYAALTISNICEEGRCQLIVMRSMPRRRATDVPFSFPSGLIEHLLRLTWDDSPRIRRASVRALSSLNIGRAAARIERLLARDSEPEVRLEAARAMAQLARTESASVMLDALHDPDWGVQCAAAQSLIDMGAPWVERLGYPPHDGERIIAWRDEIIAGVGLWR